MCALVVLAALAACGEEPPRADVDDQAPAAASSSGDDLSYSCGGATFPVAVLEDRQPPSDDLLDAIEKLRKQPEGDIVPPDGWFVVEERRERRATLLAPLADEFSHATFERKGDGWDAAGWGGCEPRLHLPEKSVLRWAFTEGAYPPDPGATVLEVDATETACSGGRDIEGLIEAQVEYREDRIDVVLTAPGLEDGFYTCQGTPLTEYEVVLSEPVGDREVVDLSVYPPVEPDPGTSLP